MVAIEVANPDEGHSPRHLLPADCLLTKRGEDMSIRIPDIIVPIELATFRPKTPREEIDFFAKYPDTVMPYDQWERFYCVSTQHRGLHCGSCLSDEEYLGVANFDDKCCCKGKI